MAEGTPLDIRVRLEDPDETGALYRVSLRRDVVGGELEADQELANKDLTGNATATFDQFKHTPEDEYFLVLGRAARD